MTVLFAVNALLVSDNANLFKSKLGLSTVHVALPAIDVPCTFITNLIFLNVMISVLASPRNNTSGATVGTMKIVVVNCDDLKS